MPRYPYIDQGMLYPAERSGPIVIGTPAWSAWIREHTTFAYQDEPIRFTARREQRHVKNIIAKLNVTNRTQAVSRARELHLL